MIEVAFLVFISLWIVGASVARLLENAKLKKITAPLIKESGEGMLKLTSGIAAIISSQNRVEEFMTEMLSEDPLPCIDATRVYAGILRSGSAIRLHMLPALTVADFKERSEAIIGKGWTADIIEYIDVHPPKEAKESPIAKKDMGVKQGLYFLQLVRDRFANERQKKTVESIIDNYKKTYDLV